MPKKYYWPTSMPEQVILVQNFGAKIGNYKTVLGLSDTQLAAINAVCEAFVEVYSATDQARATMAAMIQWRDVVFNGTDGQPSPAAPAFATAPPLSTKNGLIPQFQRFRDTVVAAPGYTEAIGEDLGIVGTEVTPKHPTLVKPVLKTVTASGVSVSIAGSMQGFDAMRVEYAPKGGDFATVAFLTNTPASFTIPGADPAEPQAGQIRTVFIKKNAAYGNYSANYPVTLG